MPLTGIVLSTANFLTADIAAGEGTKVAGELNRQFFMTALWLGVGVALYLTFTNTIGSIANPLLASLRLSATPT